MSPRTLLLLTAVFALAASGLATVLPAFATVRDTGAPARALDAPGIGADPLRPVIQSVPPPGRGPIEIKTADRAPEPSTRISVQEPAAPESDILRKNARAD